MPRLTKRNTTPIDPFQPIANGAAFGGYHFVNRKYTIDLHQDGRHTGKRVTVDRAAAVKLARDILAVEALIFRRALIRRWSQHGPGGLRRAF